LLKLLSLNIAAAAEINRLLVPSMTERGRGNLVHIGSIASTDAVASVGYNAVKAALAAYVRSLGNHLASSGLVVTGILPGGFNAPGNSWERLRADKPEVVERFVAERLPRGRLAEADELVPLIGFLCSDAASMMGGCLVPIDAGEGRTYSIV
jgi:3-oxoacyl-[acyl-carrier protein] reductase